MSPPPDDRGQQFVGGRRRRGSSTESLSVLDPSTGEVVATDSLATSADVDDARPTWRPRPTAGRPRGRSR